MNMDSLAAGLESRGEMMIMCVGGGRGSSEEGRVTTVYFLLERELFFSTDFHELTFSLDFHDILQIWFRLVAASEAALSCQLGANIDLVLDVCVLLYPYIAQCLRLLTAGCTFLWHRSKGWSSLTMRY